MIRPPCEVTVHRTPILRSPHPRTHTHTTETKILQIHCNSIPCHKGFFYSILFQDKNVPHDLLSSFDKRPMSRTLQWGEPCSAVAWTTGLTTSLAEPPRETQDSEKQVFLFSCREVCVCVYVYLCTHAMWWCYQEQLGSRCLLPPSRQNSRGKGSVLKDISLYSKASQFWIMAFYMH